MSLQQPSKLGVNIDHVATLREARHTRTPDPVSAAKLAELGGADAIVCHLREDRRHIQDNDVEELRKSIETKLTLEMAVTQEMLKIASKIKPDTACLVPEKRHELTTEGGLDVISSFHAVQEAIAQLKESGIRVSLFIDPKEDQIGMAKEAAAEVIELHTGKYCDSLDEVELNRLIKAAQFAQSIGLECNAGHGLDYSNIESIVTAFKKNNIVIHEYNIGHSIISRAVFIGLKKAVSEMKTLVQKAEGREGGS